jgi:hypothetical protein
LYVGRWAKELPAWCERYKTEMYIGPSDSAQFVTELGRLGDQHLAMMYLEIPTVFSTSIYADFLEREMVDRFCAQNSMIPALVLVDE